MRWSNRFRDFAYPATLLLAVATLWGYAAAVSRQASAEAAATRLESPDPASAMLASEYVPSDDAQAQLPSD